MEVWKDVKGYEGIYQVSNVGNVKSFKHGKEKILTPSASKGYLSVMLCKNGVKKNSRVNKIVWEAFNYKTNLSIDHINDNKLDNRIENLQAISHRENITKIGFSVTKKNHKTSKYTGVCWDKSKNKWRCQIRINGKVKHLGLYINELEASNVYQKELKASAPYIRH